MTEILSHYRFQHETDIIWKEVRRMFQEKLANFYKERIKKRKTREEKGIIVDYGTPHKSALLLTSEGNLHLTAYGWAPKPEGSGELSDIEFCLRATEVLTHS